MNRLMAVFLQFLSGLLLYYNINIHTLVAVRLDGHKINEITQSIGYSYLPDFCRSGVRKLLNSGYTNCPAQNPDAQAHCKL